MLFPVSVTEIFLLLFLNNWNRLGRHVVSAESIDSFKRRLNQNMDRDDRWDG